MLKKYIDQIKEADLVLVGVGRELSAETLIPKDAKEIREFYKEQGKHGYEKLLQEAPSEQRDTMLEMYYRNYLLSVPEFPYFRPLKEALEGKNYFIVSSNMDNLLYKSGFRSDRVVLPCGTGEFFQCEKPCEHRLYPALPGVRAMIDYYEETGKYDVLQCPNCQRKFVFNIRNEETADSYLEEGYLQLWGYYTKWLQGTINKKVLILELGEGFDIPSLFKWPFEKIAFYNQKSHLIRVHEYLYQIGEELSGKAEAVQQNSLDFLMSEDE